MKKLMVGLCLVITIVGVIYLVQAGIITWQPLTMIIAAVAAPFKFIMSFFGNEEKIRAKFADERAEERAQQTDFDTRIKQREERVGALRKEVEDIDAELQILRKKRQAGTTAEKNITDKQQERQDLLGE
ncbi:MAG: hypothetical protein E2O76_00590 [Caldithrix sp.]|nr:MAG: hypothetical protein E2O76_00590 [Caldithrix sp.]